MPDPVEIGARPLVFNYTSAQLRADYTFYSGMLDGSNQPTGTVLGTGTALADWVYTSPVTLTPVETGGAWEADWFPNSITNCAVPSGTHSAAVTLTFRSDISPPGIVGYSVVSQGPGSVFNIPSVPIPFLVTLSASSTVAGSIGGSLFFQSFTAPSTYVYTSTIAYTFATPFAGVSTHYIYAYTQPTLDTSGWVSPSCFDNVPAAPAGGSIPSTAVYCSSEGTFNVPTQENPGGSRRR